MYARSLAFPWPLRRGHGQRKTGQRGYGLWSSTPHSHGPFTVARKIAHGGGAGLLILSAAGALVNSDPQTADSAPGQILDQAPAAPAIEALTSSAANFDLSSFNGLTEAFLGGAFNDPLQIAGAIFVFLSAGQCIARFLGLAAVMLAFGLHSQGVTIADLTQFASTAAERIEAATTAFADPSLVDQG